MTGPRIANVTFPVLTPVVSATESATQAVPQPTAENYAEPASMPSETVRSSYGRTAEAKLRKTLGRSKEKTKAKNGASKNKVGVGGMKRKQHLLDDELPSDERDASINEEVIVSTGDRMWYLAMVAVDGIPLRELRTKSSQKRKKVRKV